MGDLLLRPALNRLLLAARQAYDFVIVDSVPILAADDTPSLAPKTDGVIFVVRDSFTRSTAAGLALRTLYARHVAVLGIVFNRVSGGSKFSYNQYSEYYGRPQTVDLKDEVALPS
jgi:Mrp family chromosome partitioning ATPase